MLFAVRTAWVVILFLLAGVLIVWFVFRIIGDAITWVKEEMFDEFHDLRKQSDEARKAKRKAQDEENPPD